MDHSTNSAEARLCACRSDRPGGTHRRGPDGRPGAHRPVAAHGIHPDGGTEPQGMTAGDGHVWPPFAWWRTVCAAVRLTQPPSRRPVTSKKRHLKGDMVATRRRKADPTLDLSTGCGAATSGHPPGSGPEPLRAAKPTHPTR